MGHESDRADTDLDGHVCLGGIKTHAVTLWLPVQPSYCEPVRWLRSCTARQPVLRKGA